MLVYQSAKLLRSQNRCFSEDFVMGASWNYKYLGSWFPPWKKQRLYTRKNGGNGRRSGFLLEPSSYFSGARNLRFRKGTPLEEKTQPLDWNSSPKSPHLATLGAAEIEIPSTDTCQGLQGWPSPLPKQKVAICKGSWETRIDFSGDMLVPRRVSFLFVCELVLNFGIFPTAPKNTTR